MDSKPHKESLKKMKQIKVKGKRKPITMAEWKDVKGIVKAHLKKYKGFYEELAEL